MTNKEITAMQAVFYLARQEFKRHDGGLFYGNGSKISFYEALGIVNDLLYGMERNGENG